MIGAPVRLATFLLASFGIQRTRDTSTGTDFTADALPTASATVTVTVAGPPPVFVSSVPRVASLKFGLNPNVAFVAPIAFEDVGVHDSRLPVMLHVAPPGSMPEPESLPVNVIAVSSAPLVPRPRLHQWAASCPQTIPGSLSQSMPAAG